jgi:hypothetical protein
MIVAVRRRLIALTISAILLVCAAVSVPFVRTPMLRAAGWALVASDPVETADIIVVSTDANGGGMLEASDLVRSGVAARVAVFTDPPDVVDAEFVRRGIAYEDAAERSVRQLMSLGVKHIERIPRTIAGSESEGRVLPGWCDERKVGSIVVVSTPDHSRRLRRILRRSMEGHSTIVHVRPARYSTFDPDEWWTTRDGIRIEIVELQKLMLDIILHPFS